MVEESGECIIKACGLPWSTKAKAILDFFHDCEIVGGEEGIHLTLDDQGRPSGECFVVLASNDDLGKAKAHNKEHIGSRYIEIYDSTRADMEWQINRKSGGGENTTGDSDGTFVKLRGLPYGATKEDIAKFFSGIEIAPYGITITMDQEGRCSGEGYVELASPDAQEAALKKDKESIGHRYIEVFKCSRNDVKYVAGYGGGGGGGYQARSLMAGSRPGPYDRPGGGYGGYGGGFNGGGFVARNRFGGRGGRGGGRNMGEVHSQESTTGHSVHMRGLPFTSTQQDVYQFFAPLKPVAVRILHDETGRAKGECDVDFSSHSDAESAMSKDKQNIGHRYIELFLRSTEGGNSWANNAPPIQPPLSSTNPSGYGAGYGSAPGAAYGGATGGNFGDYSSNGYGYSSFSENTSYSNIPQAAGNSYYSNNSF